MEREAYLRVAEYVHTAMVNVPDIALKTVMLDYERVFILAFSEYFPVTTFFGCDFHWKSFLRKNIGAHALMTLYNNDAEFALLIKYIWALPYVPMNFNLPV